MTIEYEQLMARNRSESGFKALLFKPLASGVSFSADYGFPEEIRNQ
jgi:hypothetical protein